MSELTLEQVKKLAEQLTPEERQELWKYIADLPNSGINTFDPPTLIIDNKKLEESDDRAVIVSAEAFAAILLKRRIMFQLFFYPEAYQLSRLEIRSWANSLPTEKVKEHIRELLMLHGSQEMTEEELIAICQQSTSQAFEVETYRFAREMSARVGHMAWLLFEGGMKMVELSVHNDISRQFGRRTKPLNEIIKILEPYWKHIKEHLNLSPGGRQNVKHEWTFKDHACLAVHYDRLKPIWREAKKTARAALKSTEPTRRRNWREQVIAAYKDEELPTDLVEQLAPSANSQPADLALLHASRICLPVSYSTKVLKEKLKKFNPVPRPSSKSSKNRGSS